MNDPPIAKAYCKSLFAIPAPESNIMADTARPQSILNAHEIMALEPIKRKNYVHNKIMDILGSNQNGVTVSEVEKLTGFDKRTVWRHLENLVAISEGYKKERAGMVLYYKNGRLGHPSKRQTCNLNDKCYVFDRLENNEGDFILIQEKEKGPFGSMRTKGGIMINVRDYPMVMKTLLAFSAQVVDK